MARLTVADLPQVQVVVDRGMLVDLFDRIGADVIVKGVRNEKDRVYEEEMAAYNLAKNPRAKTVLLDADPAMDAISSSAVREKMAKGESPVELLVPAVLDYLVARGECSKEKKE